MSDLLARIENLSPARRKLLERMSANKEQQRRTYPLSYAQRGMWFLDQLEPDSALYSMPFGFKLTGPLNEEVVWQSVREIVRRHESLSTIFPERNGVAVQEVVPGMQHPMEKVDLTQLPERDDEIRKRIRQEILKPFNLAQGPLFRGTLFKLGEREHVLVLNMHHIVSDGWSVGVLEHEFDALYKAFSAGELSPLPELELQYGDYTVWQRGWLQSGAMQEQLEYWKKQLAEVAEVVLPTDHPRPSMLTHRGRTVEFPLPTKFSAELKEFCRREGVTLFMALLAGLQLALSRYTGVRDFTIGTPIANRNRLETEKLIGCFINTLVLRTDLKGQPSFRQLLARVRETTLGAYEHQDMPFEKLVEELIPAQSLRWTPLFQVLLVLQNFPTTDNEQSGLSRSRVDTGLDLAKIEMALTVLEREGALFGSLQYDADLFDRKRMQRLMEHFCLVLERMVFHPEENIWESSLLPQSERDQVLDEWNRTRAEYPQEKPLHALVEEQAARTPEAVAVVQEEQQLTYSELNRRANRLAHHLRALGVEPETAVGVCMERSLEMFVALLGILKAGGVYVPLDPAYPADRLQFMAEDARLKALIVHDASLHVAPESDALVVDLSRDVQAIELERDDNLVPTNTPENLAYVIYTSGSTGKPKGVGISHRAACNQLCWASQAFQLSAADRFLQKASISFDSSVEEIFAPLVAGARIVAARPRGEHDIEYLAELVAGRGVTCIDLPPSLLQAFVDYADPTAWASVRLFISGGEALRPELVKLFQEKFSATLLNTYGPTEATVQSAWADGLEDGESIPIGRPVANTQLYVLDENFEPVPVGAGGELYIGGAGVARGYLNRPELTAEKFVPNPFSAGGGERLYRTGDLVKWRNDGQLDFVGRTDHQVKLRGYRIELGEIETALESHPQVKQAVVMVREDQPGIKRLVAYIIKPAEGTLSTSALREHLRERLPDYMIPAAWVELEELPLSPNGKVDRKALPEPEGRWISDEQVRPRNVTEEILVGLWEAVLKQDTVSIEANFFDLGGHSLLAMQLISRIRKAFSVELPLRVLFESPTVVSMAEHIRQQLQLEPAVEIPAIVRAPRSGSLPLSFAQQRLWFLDQLVPGSAAYNIPLAVRLSGTLDPVAFRWSWQEIVRRHDALRTRFPQRDGTPVQEIGNPEEWQLAEIDLRSWSLETTARDAEVQKLAHEEAEKPFDLATGPLLRVKLVQLEEQEHVLFVTMHHIVSDGWSIGIMMREVSQLYGACLAGENSPLQELELQYADYAVWQQNWLQGEVLERQLGYWKKQLADIQPLDLPTRRVRSELATSAEASMGWELSQELSAGLKTLSRRQGVTLFMTLLAAFKVLLSRYSGQNDVVVGTPIAGRRLEETHSLMGFFVNTLVLRTSLNGDPSFTELLARVRETTLEADAHQDVPFEKLVEELQPERDLSRQPFFQVMFALHHAENSSFPLVGLQVSGLDLEGNKRTAKFDLMLGVEEANGRIQGSFEYNLDLFDPEMMETMARHWHLVLEQLVKESAQPISHVSLFTQDDNGAATQWSGPAVEDREQNIGALVAGSAERYPQAPAVSGRDGELSYTAVNRRANQWAHYLIKLGVNPGTRVGICLDQAVDWLPASLGVLKSGAVVVGLEPDEPTERIAMMLESSAASVVITTKRLAAQIPETAVKLVLLDEQQAELASESDQEPDVVIHSASPACLVYRSSAASRPLGIVISHRTLCGPAFPKGEAVRESDRVAHVCSFSFESASIEIFRTLARGACVVGLPAHPAVAPRKLAALLRDQKVTVLWTSASTLEPLVREFPWALKNVRQIFCEDRPEGLVQLREKLKADVLQRVYGVQGYSETGGSLMVYPLASASETAMNVEHLAPGVRIYLLDAGMKPAATGVLGEVFAGGEFVALGYDQGEQHNVDVFIPDPFSGQPSAQMYKTGDRARLHPHGTLEYRGRTDRRLIRGGLRLQLEEIESALLEHEGITQAAVLIPGASGETKSGLAALVVTAEGQVISEQDLRSFLLRKLPQAMTPRSITQVEKIIRTAQGKVIYDQAVYVAPRTPIEQEIAQIWRELLEVERVSMHDDFFRLGGHSLLAVRLKTMLHDRLKWAMPLADLFRAPTIARLARLMEQAQNAPVADEPSSSVLVEIQSGGASTPVFFVHPVGGNVLCYIDLARELGPEQPFYALQSPGAGTSAEEVGTFEQMAQLYIRMMQRVQPTGPYLLGGWSLGGLLAWEIARKLTDKGESIGLLALIDTYPPSRTRSAEAEQDALPMLSWFAQDMARLLGEDTEDQSRHFQQLAPEQQLTFVQEALTRHGIVSRENAKQETANLMEVFTRNVQAMESYQLRRTDQHVILLAAADADAPEQLARDWKTWAGGGVDFHLVPGNHYSMIRQPHVAGIAEALRHGLNEIAESASFAVAGGLAP